MPSINFLKVPRAGRWSTSDMGHINSVSNITEEEWHPIVNYCQASKATRFLKRIIY